MPKLGVDVSPRPHAHRRACTTYLSMLQENYFSLVTNFRAKEVKSKVLLTYFFKRTKSTLLKFYSKIAVNTNFEISSHSQLTCNVSLFCSIDDLTRVATHHLFDLDLFTFIFLMKCY